MQLGSQILPQFRVNPLSLAAQRSRAHPAELLTVQRFTLGAKSWHYLILGERPELRTEARESFNWFRFFFLSRIVVLGQHAKVYKQVTFGQQQPVSRFKTITHLGR